MDFGPMASRPKLLHRLTSPVWWEDVFPGFFYALPKIVILGPGFLARAIPVTAGHVAF